MTGDVETEDLSKIHNELKNNVFGKTFEDGTCAMSKLISYYQKDSRSVGWKDFFGTTAALTLGFSEYGNTYDLVSDIQSSEDDEGAFEDTKRKLIDDIQNELKGFCKTGTQPEQGNQSTGNQSQLANNSGKKIKGFKNGQPIYED